MASSIPILAAGPSSVLNPDYDNRGYSFSIRALAQIQTPPNLRIRTLSNSSQLLRFGTVTYDPIIDYANGRISGWPAFEALWRICKQSDPHKGCLFFASDDHFLDDGIIGVGDGANTDFQLRRVFTAGSDTVYQNIYYPIHAWASALETCGVTMQNTLVVTDDNTPVPGTDWTLTNTTGRIVFDTAPLAGHVIRATCHYVHPIYLLDMSPDVSWTANLATIKDLRFMEVPQ